MSHWRYTMDKTHEVCKYNICCFSIYLQLLHYCICEHLQLIDITKLIVISLS